MKSYAPDNPIPASLQAGGPSLEDLDLALFVATLADEKMATDLRMLDISSVHSLFDIFVIATVANSRQLKSVVDHIVDRSREDLDRRPRSVEGLGKSEWVLLDFGSIAVHLFSKEAREFYSLERLWSDAGEITFSQDEPLRS